jgi:NAD(P)H-dependent FMN reductase
MSKLQVIVGTTRPTRAADQVFPWVAAEAQRHGAFDVEVVDLRDWQLPFFQEHLGTARSATSPTPRTPTRSSRRGTARSPKATPM